MTSRSAVGNQHPLQQQPAVQAGPPGSARHAALHTPSGTTPRSTSNADSPSINSHDLANWPLIKDGYTSTAQASPSGRSEQEPLSTPEYTQVAPLPPRPWLNSQNRRVLPTPSTIPQIPVKPTNSAQSAAENRRQNVDIPVVARVFPQGSK